MTHFWAKTIDKKIGISEIGISVYDHSLNVGHVALCIADITPCLLERFRLQSTQVAALAALHDLGKISPGFQRKCVAWLIENGLEKIARNGCWDTAMESDHGKVSHSAIQIFLGANRMDRKAAKFIAAALGAHHGRLNPPNDRGYRPPRLMSDSASLIDWDKERTSTAHRICEWFRVGDNFSLEVDDSTPALWWLAGLTSVADWIGSDECFFSPERRVVDADVASQAQHALHAIGFFPSVCRADLSFEDLFGFPPNEMQTQALVSISSPGVYIVEAPMGMGKTEAALGAAYHLLVAGKASGIYFALPTQATSNRMHLRINEFLRRITPESQASRLIHGNSWLKETEVGVAPAMTAANGLASDDARIGRDWFASTKRALLAPFGVGTVDQALLGVVAAKHFFVRHFALAGKVVILDEIHSYDLYTGTLIDKLIATLEGLGCTVIVLSATLTGRRREQLVSVSDDNDDAEQPYPLITGRREGETFAPVTAVPPASKEIQVEFVTGERAVEEALRVASSGGAVLWICNAVDAAQQQYRRFASLSSPQIVVGLLHSRFPFWRREELETEWMERFGKDGNTRCGSILVSTQVVEQSVDLDADLMITELAPTDMLLQRLGRLWRHDRGKRPVDCARLLIIEEGSDLDTIRSMEAKEIMTILGSKARVYAPFVLLRSLEVWKTQTAISIPEQIRRLLESTYKNRENEPASWQQLADDWFGSDSAKRMLAQRNSNLWQVALEDEEGVQTRLNEMPTVAVVLCRVLSRYSAGCFPGMQLFFSVFLDQSKGYWSRDQYQLATAQAIHKNLVKVPRYCFERVESCPAFTDYLHGGQCAGIITEEGTVEVHGLKSGVGLFYTDDLGLVIEQTDTKEEGI